MKTLVEYCKDQFVFEKLLQDTLYYVAPDKFLVRVPVADLDGAMIRAEEKGMVLMKWIRKELKGIQAE
jgi:hypothetical protein